MFYSSIKYTLIYKIASSIYKNLCATIFEYSIRYIRIICLCTDTCSQTISSPDVQNWLYSHFESSVHCLPNHIKDHINSSIYIVFAFINIIITFIWWLQPTVNSCCCEYLIPWWDGVVCTKPQLCFFLPTMCAYWAQTV